MFGDNVILHWLWKETVRYLESLARSVHEGRAVDEASNFSRWLQFSGLLKIFEAYPQASPLTVDGEAVRRLMEQVISSAGQIHKGGTLPVNPSQSRIDELNDKVDVILSHLAKKISPLDMNTSDVGQPALRVILGGVSSSRAVG